MVSVQVLPVAGAGEKPSRIFKSRDCIEPCQHDKDTLIFMLQR